jgi:hypothetical protein
MDDPGDAGGASEVIRHANDGAATRDRHRVARPRRTREALTTKDQRFLPQHSDATIK